VFASCDLIAVNSKIPFIIASKNKHCRGPLKYVRTVQEGIIVGAFTLFVAVAVAVAVIAQL
jgi:hypothetical protein